jgi:hypothetical protein
LLVAGTVSAVAAQTSANTVELAGGQALIRFQGLSMLIDPDGGGEGDYAAVDPMPAVDLVLLRGCGPSQLAWLERQTLERAVLVLGGPACATELRGQGVLRARLLQLWDAYSLRKGAASVRLTVMPGVGAAPAAMQAEALGVMLDFSDGGKMGCRIYAAGEVEEAALLAIPQHFPGATLAIVRRDGVPVLGVAETARDGSRSLRVVPGVAAGELGYRIKPERSSPSIARTR